MDAMAASTSIPIVHQIQVDLGARMHRKLQALSDRLLANEPTLNRTDMFGPRVSAGLSPAPSVIFEDHTEMALFNTAADAPLEYRSFLLGDEDDFFVLSGERFRDFETYCREALGLGARTVLKLHHTQNNHFKPISRQCLDDPVILDALCRAAKDRGQFNVVPYIGTGNAWHLASIIASRSGAEVHVAAPPPRLTRRANDKLWFLERVNETLGAGSAPPSYSIFGPAALSARIRAIASRSPRVVVKVPDSSGSLGNVMIRSEDVAGLSLKQIQRRFLDVLMERGWKCRYPLLVGIWDHPVIASPSVNLWIPKRDEGAPIIEGLFTQALAGKGAEFIGAEPCDLPNALEERIVWGASCLAQYFQNLGYFGRCGFDLILVGGSLEKAEVHWIECNGRWGGVSIPITVANRLIGDWARKFVIVVQQTKLAMPPRSFPSILDTLKDNLFDPSGDQQGIVLLAPGRLVDGSGMNLMVLADSKCDGRWRLQTAMGILASAP